MSITEAHPETTETTSPEVETFLERVRSAGVGGGGQGSHHLYVLLLGMHQALDTAMLVREIEKGLPFRFFTNLQRHMALPLKELANITQIKYRTLSRRKEAGRLEPDESDRLLRLTRIFGRALELFEGSEEAARRWLSKPQRALGGATPLEMAKTEIGALEVERLIGRLEHGVFT